MSKERARAREARLAERERERERAAKARARKERLDALKPSLPSLPSRRPRQRRYGAMSLRLRLGLAFGWLVVQWLAWQVFPDARSRLGIALVSLFALPVVVVLSRTPPRGS